RLTVLLLVRVLRHRRPFVLSRVSEAERELALRPEPERAELVGPEARCDRELPLVQALLRCRGGVVDVAGHPDDVRSLTEELHRRLLRLLRVELVVDELEL